MSGVYYCHQKGYILRDIKPEGISVQKNEMNIFVKHTHFGAAEQIGPGEFLSDVQGSPYYVSPEVLKKKYD